MVLIFFVFLLFADMRTNQQLGANNNTVLLLHLNKGSGTTVYDVSGQGKNGTINGAVWCEGLWENCLDFDGTDDYVDLGPDVLTKVNDFTITLWFKCSEVPAGNSGNWSTIIELLDGSGIYGIRIENTGIIWFHTTLGNYASTNNSYLDGKWHFVACVHSSVRGQEIWVDGELDGSKPENTGDLEVGSWYNYLGNYRSSSMYTEWYKGSLEEITIWDRPLTGAEIKYLYQSQCGKYQ